MRRSRVLAAVMTGGALVAAFGSGCSSSNCTFDETCAPGPDAGDSGVKKDDGASPPHDGASDAKADAHKDSAHEDSAADAAMHDAGQDVTRDAFTCDPTASPMSAACVITEEYGVFVAPAANGGSDTSGMGSRTAPYATISKGITQAKAAGKRVYACAATYAEQVVVNAAVDGVQVYGGLACPELADGGGDAGGAAWTYSGGLAAVEPAAVGYALDVESLATGAHFEDMAFAPQVAPSSPGGSSIAVMVNASMAVSFTRVSAKALAGVAGVSPGARRRGRLAAEQ